MKKKFLKWVKNLYYAIIGKPILYSRCGDYNEWNPEEGRAGFIN